MEEAWKPHLPFAELNVAEVAACAVGVLPSAGTGKQLRVQATEEREVAADEPRPAEVATVDPALVGSPAAAAAGVRNAAAGVAAGATFAACSDCYT